MTINICWVDKPLKSSEPIKITTDIAVLVLYQADGVITKTEWQLALSADVPIIDRQCLEIQRYLNTSDSDLTVNLYKQGSEFRHKVWNEICKIPMGEVLSYSQLAVNVGSGARAVANACRDNLFPGIIPCHRIVASSGLGGFMGQTQGAMIDLKKALLMFEQNGIH